MRPLILDYSIDRTGEFEAKYEYNDLLSLNVIRTDDTVLPFIDIESVNINLTTITKVLNESNTETDSYNTSLLEMMTKTRVLQEAEDTPSYLLELTTKTLVKQESDD